MPEIYTIQSFIDIIEIYCVTHIWLTLLLECTMGGGLQDSQRGNPVPSLSH